MHFLTIQFFLQISVPHSHDIDNDEEVALDREDSIAAVREESEFRNIEQHIKDDTTAANNSKTGITIVIDHVDGTSHEPSMTNSSTALRSISDDVDRSEMVTTASEQPMPKERFMNNYVLSPGIDTPTQPVHCRLYKKRKSLSHSSLAVKLSTQQGMQPTHSVRSIVRQQVDEPPVKKCCLHAACGIKIFAKNKNEKVYQYICPHIHKIAIFIDRQRCTYWLFH